MKLKRKLLEYRHGCCHIFALALHKVTGWRIESYWDMCPEDDDCTSGLVHAYVVSPDGKYVDCTGAFNPKDLEEEFGDVGEGDTCTETVDTLKEFGVINENEISGLMEYIRKHPKKYSL